MTELQDSKFEQDSRIRRLEAEVHERQTDFQRVTLELEEVTEKLRQVILANKYPLVCFLFLFLNIFLMNRKRNYNLDFFFQNLPYNLTKHIKLNSLIF